MARGYGRINEISQYPLNSQAMLKMSCYVVTEAFKRNYELLRIVNKSVNEQRKEIESIYGLRVNAGTMSEFKNGKRFKCGLLLLMAIKHYWLVKGYDFRIDL